MPVRRNLIVILGHGLRSDVLSDSQAWPLTTPNMEKLAERGLRLVATSACPADPGGMVSLLTGLHARQHGYLDPTSNVTCEGWPAALAGNGYHLVGVGCVRPIEPWLHDAVIVEDVEKIEAPGCAYLRAMHERGQLAAVQLQRRQRKRSGPFEPDRLLLEPDDDVDGFIAVQASAKLAAMPGNKPWALVVAFSGPGNDLPPPTMYDELLDTDGLDAGFLPADFKAVDALAELDYPRIMLQRLEPRTIARIRADYLGRVSLIDHGVGRLMREISQREDRTQAWMVLSADRGCLLGEQGLVGHRSFLCGAVEVPVIIAPPTPVAHHHADGLVSSIDVAATIATLGGADLPQAVTGRSLLPALAGEPLPNSLHHACVSEFGKRLLLETERHKIVFHTETHHALGLYDLANDPDETENLIDTPEGSNLLDALRWRLAEALLPLRSQPGHA